MGIIVFTIVTVYAFLKRLVELVIITIKKLPLQIKPNCIILLICVSFQMAMIGSTIVLSEYLIAVVEMEKTAVRIGFIVANVIIGILSYKMYKNLKD